MIKRPQFIWKQLLVGIFWLSWNLSTVVYAFRFCYFWSLAAISYRKIFPAFDTVKREICGESPPKKREKKSKLFSGAFSRVRFLFYFFCVFLLILEKHDLVVWYSCSISRQLCHVKFLVIIVFGSYNEAARNKTSSRTQLRHLHFEVFQGKDGRNQWLIVHEIKLMMVFL